MPCSKGSGPGCVRLQVRLTVYFRTATGANRSLSRVYDRSAAAYRLRFARKLEDFMGYSVEAA